MKTGDFAITTDDKIVFREIFKILGGGDERMPPNVVMGYASTEEKALVMAVGQGWYGGPGKVTPVHAIQIGQHVFALEQAKPVDLDFQLQKAEEFLRQKALAKLSPEDIRLLGIKT